MKNLILALCLMLLAVAPAAACDVVVGGFAVQSYGAVAVQSYCAPQVQVFAAPQVYVQPFAVHGFAVQQKVFVQQQRVFVRPQRVRSFSFNRTVIR